MNSLTLSTIGRRTTCPKNPLSSTQPASAEATVPTALQDHNATTPIAGAERPHLARDTDGHPGSRAALRRRPGALRPVQRVLPAVPGPDADLQLRLLRARRHDTRRSADRQDRPVPRQARTPAGDDAARHRLR